MVVSDKIQIDTNPRSEDLLKIAKNMREADKVEVKAWADVDPVDAVFQSVLRADCAFVVKVDGEPAIAFGFSKLGTILNSSAAPWMLATDAIHKIPVAFLRQSRHFVEAALEKYGRLENWVDAENAVSKRWLEWLGFRVEEHSFVSRRGRHFEYFWMQSEGK